MVRVIKRYESRKLYDTEESRYVSLDEIATWIRKGQDIRVIDNSSNEDVTVPTLTQLILDEGRVGRSKLPAELMHNLVRFGERAFASGVEHVQDGVDRLVQASFDRLGPVKEAREEMQQLRKRLEELESTLTEIEKEEAEEPPKKSKAAGKKSAKRKKTTGKKKAR